jgi:UDP:flavonoid glycosyltransferase YjiC (YdhE family)
VFAYLHNEYRHVDAILDALAASRARCLVYLKGGTAAVVQKYGSPRLAFSNGMLDLAATVAASDICVCHGNVGTVMSILRGGKPMLLLPVQLEHFLLASKVEKLGIARVIHPDTEQPDISGMLARVMQEDSLSSAAREFALKHCEPAIDTIVVRAANRIEELA